MSEEWVIEITIPGPHKGWVKDLTKILQFVQHLHMATRYPTELDAKCLCCYIDKIHKPMPMTLEEAKSKTL